MYTDFIPINRPFEKNVNKIKRKRFSKGGINLFGIRQHNFRSL